MAPQPQPAYDTRAEQDELPPRRVAPPVARTEAPAPAARIEDDMPAPASQPKEPARAAAADPIGDDAENFIAPRNAGQRNAPGTPPADVLERMRRAAAAQPGAQARAPQAPARKPEPEAPARGESRMAGLGRMIERMAGHGTTSDKPSASSLADRVSERLSARRQGNLDTEFDDLADDSQAGNAEIPAFLRRQAN